VTRAAGPTRCGRAYLPNHTRQPRIGIGPESAQYVFGLLGSDYDGSPYTQSGDLVAELAVRGIRLVVICCRSGQFPK
jgi:hypothetical protein